MRHNKTIQMDETKNVSPEELAAEHAALQESKEDDIRAKIITEYGFDEVDDVERIDKLVAKEMDYSKKLSSAIGQKIKWRTEATKPKEEKAPVVPPQDKSNKVELDPETVTKLVSETLEKRELDSMDLPDTLKADIKKVAQSMGISNREAMKDPYIVFKVNEYKKENDIEEASISRTNRAGGSKVVSFDNPPDVDMSTPEGRATWDKYKADQIKKGH